MACRDMAEGKEEDRGGNKVLILLQVAVCQSGQGQYIHRLESHTPRNR